MAAPDTATVRGYMRQDGLDSVAIGTQGTFYPDAGLARSEPARLIPCRLRGGGSDRCALSHLAQRRPDRRAGRSRPCVCARLCRVPATFDVSRRPGRVVERGTVILAGARESLILTMLRNVGRPEGRLPSDMVAERVAPTARAIARRLPP